LEGKPADAIENLTAAAGDPILAPYCTILLARSWLEVPVVGAAQAMKHGEELVRLRPRESAAYLEAARVFARAAALGGSAAAPPARDRAVEMLRAAVNIEPGVTEKLAKDTAFDSIRSHRGFPK
jgi:hypothetical protein